MKQHAGFERECFPGRGKRSLSLGYDPEGVCWVCWNQPVLLPLPPLLQNRQKGQQKCFTSSLAQLHHTQIASL